jgi:DNA-binding NtrC family response regulator
MPRLLAIDDSITVLRTLERLLRARGHALVTVESGEEALARVVSEAPDLVLCDVQMPGIGGFETLRRLGQAIPGTPVIIMTGLNDVETAVRAFKLGAVDFIVKPFEEAKLHAAIDSALEVRAAPRGSQPGAAGAPVGESAPFREAMDLAVRYARPDINILLEGETGTGKELFARAIHAASKRRAGPFVPVDCSMLAESLIESELFGHEKGAFTGAAAARIGQFERADGGTLFLDEVGNLSYGVQAKLLRVLQERTFERVGGRETRRLDIRVVSAANVDLRQAGQRGAFRTDLYYRLAEATIGLPPLRERPGDVRRLAEHFVARYAVEFEAPVRGISAAALARLEAHAWPGNVRELENVVKAAVVLASGVVEPDHLRALLEASAGPRPSRPTPAAALDVGPPSERPPDSLRVEMDIPVAPLDLKAFVAHASERAEQVFLEALVRQGRHSQAHLAKLMNVDPKTLRAKLRKYGLDGG